MEDLLSAAARFVNTTSGHIFLTGKAGTGKTTFLKNLSKLTHKSYIVVASTGIAALNAGGVTIHSQFLLPPFTFLPDRSLGDSISDDGRFINQNTLARKHPLNSVRKQVLRSIDLLVIDEVSMLRADLLDAIDYRMKAARGNYRQSFGGVQVLFIGDLYQLPPVVRNDQWDTLSKYYNSAWFYEAHALRDDAPVYIELEKIFRQNDSSFIDILNNLRNNIPAKEDINTLNNHFKTPEEISDLKEIITLTTHNYKADEINLKELKNLKSPSRFFEATMEGEFPESMFPVQQNLELKEGAQIMFVRNDNDGKMYFNGKLATVTKISGNDVWVEMAESHIKYQLKPVLWENKKYAVRDGDHELAEEMVGSFEQFPVRLAWAITVHKSQGLTFDKAIIDVGEAFADGQVYVALSRLRTLEGLVLRAKINSSVISTAKLVMAFAQKNHKPSELTGVMKSRQQQFLRQLLDRTFDFGPLVKDIQYVHKDQGEEGLGNAKMKPVLVQIANSLETEQTNTEKFRRQLMELLDSGDPIVLVDRIKKGASYYKSYLFQNIKLLLQHLEVVKQKKRVKTYITQLSDLDQVFSKKWEDIDKAATLTEGILNNNERFNFDHLSKVRVQERNVLLQDIIRQTGSEPSDEPKKKTKKPKKVKDGDERSTFEITLDMINKGMSAEQIAEERGLVLGTIESHLAKAVAEGSIDIFKFMNEEIVIEIINARRQLPLESSSKDLYEKMKGKFGYGQLRAVIAYDKLKEQQ